MSLNVSLTPSLEGFVHDKVMAGEYESASEVVQEALHLFKRREELSQMEMREKIDAGRRSLQAGQGVSADSVWAKLEAVIAEAEKYHEAKTCQE